MPSRSAGSGSQRDRIGGVLVRRGEIEQVLAFLLPPLARGGQSFVKIRGSANFYWLTPNAGEGARSVSGGWPFRVRAE